jgi:diguanylate cyclase (GGDEF)-like protein
VAKLVPSTATVSLLLAEDEALRRALAEALAERGHITHSCATLRQALQVSAGVNAELVVVQWPGADGSGERWCREVPPPADGEDRLVLAVVHPADPAATAAALDCGAGDVLLWPADARVLQSRLRVLENRIRETRRTRAAVEQRLARDVAHDPLTGLPDRTRFVDRLQRVFERARRHGSQPFAVLFLDVDRFKLVNDSLGHLAGDQLLVSISKRLADSLRPADSVARLGGDEYAVILDDVADPREATVVADRIQKSLRVPFDLNGQEVYATVSIGISHYGSEYQSADDLLRDADTAMYRAKALGRDRYAVFDQGMHEKVVTALQLENDLRRALDAKEFVVYYQPIIELAGGHIVGFEALVRWNHPRRGLALPGDFVQVAEETGLIIAIDRWVASEACRQLRAWQVQFKRNPPLTMSINVSGGQFMQPDLPMQIDRTLRENGLWGSVLKLEITESVIMDKARYTGPILEHLRGLAIKLSIDDFGTGYSSLSYLRRFEIDTLKIDSSFVGKMTKDEEAAEIVRAIITLAQNLHKDLIAEGVETASQLARLREMRCTFAQGFYFSRPVTAQAATQLIAANPRW